LVAPEPVCAQCGAAKGVELEDARTNYIPEVPDVFDRLRDDGDPPDPNAPLPLCRACAKAHHEYFDDVWREYNAGLL
jgi:hypothetical protein